MNDNPKPISDAELVGMMQRNQKSMREQIERLESEIADLHAKLAVACEFAPRISRCLCGSYKAEGYVCNGCGSHEH